MYLYIKHLGWRVSAGFACVDKRIASHVHFQSETEASYVRRATLIVEYRHKEASEFNCSKLYL